MKIKMKRVYEAAAADDGRRVLVDRLWPRGISKEKGGIDLWLKEVAPSTELRKWFNHEPEKWPEFERRYCAELRENPAFAELQRLAAEGPLTLLYAARDQERNEAVVLLQLLQ